MDQQEMNWQLATVAPELGSSVAGRWIVDALIEGPNGQPAATAHDADGAAHAFLFFLGDEGADPAVSEQQSELFGTVRRLVRDDRYGRVLIDEVPQGVTLAQRLAGGGELPLGIRAELQRRLREAHHEGVAHGALREEFVVLAPGELAIAGWGLDPSTVDDARARDLAVLSSWVGVTSPPTPVRSIETVAEASATAIPSEPPSSQSEQVKLETAPSGTVPGLSVALRAAIVADHLPTLRKAWEQWLASGGNDQEPDGVRAKDALSRLEQKVAAALAEAQRLLANGDMLGATALCREAIRLGAEEEAGELLKQARKQARSALNGSWLTQRRTLGLFGSGAALLIIVAIWAVSAMRHSSAERAARTEFEGIARQRGERAAVEELFERRSRHADDIAEKLLGEHLQLLAVEERSRMVKLRAVAVSQGARPQEADQITEKALEELDQLAAGDPAVPGLQTRFQRLLMQLERAASLYQVSTEITAAEAARGVDALLQEDALFGPTGGAR